MKGMQGLVIALALGLAAGLFNWLYLASKAGRVESVGFVGISAKASLARGDRLAESQLAEVRIPQNSVGNLADFAIPWTARQTVIGSPVRREKSGGELLLRDDLETPPAELKFAETERVIWIPVDNRTFVPSLVEPGALVSFLAAAGAGSTLASTDESVPTPAASPPPPPAGPIDAIGPFRILSLGNRLGSADVHRAARLPQMQENVIAIAVEVDNAGALDAKAQKLLKMLNETNFRPMGIMLHPRKNVE